MTYRLRPLKQLDGKRVAHAGQKGVRLFTLIGELSNGKPTVLINGGWASVPELYYSIAEGFSKRGFAVMIVSMRGIGGVPIGDSTSATYIQDNVKDSLFVLQEHGVKELILAPHSCGAQVALSLSALLEETDIKLKGVIFNAPSIPDTISAFPNSSFFNKIIKYAVKLLLNLVSFTNGKKSLNLISRAISRITVIIFRLVNPLLIRNTSKASKEVFGEFWRRVANRRNDVLAISLAAIVRDGELTKSALFSLDVPALVVSYEDDSLVSCRIGESLAPYFEGKPTRLMTGLVKGESHFGHEVNPDAFFGHVDPFMNFIGFGEDGQK